MTEEPRPLRQPTIAVPVHEWARMRYKAKLLDDTLDGNRELPFVAPYDDLGVAVRDAWVTWACSQPNPKQSWLVPYDHLEERDKQADRMIGMQVARWTLIREAARLSALLDPPGSYDSAPTDPHHRDVISDWQHREVMKRQEDEIARLRSALTDMHSGWLYIREHHGDLYGVGWDRCQAAAEAALKL